MKTKDKISILKKWCKSVNSVSSRKFYVMPEIEKENGADIVSVEVSGSHFVSNGQIEVICANTGLYFYGIMNINSVLILQFSSEEI